MKHFPRINAKVLTGPSCDAFFFIPRIDFAPDLPFTLRKQQFTIRVAFTMTINKSHGQKFKKVGIYLPEPVFAHGQFHAWSMF